MTFSTRRREARLSGHGGSISFGRSVDDVLRRTEIREALPGGAGRRRNPRTPQLRKEALLRGGGELLLTASRKKRQQQQPPQTTANNETLFAGARPSLSRVCFLFCPRRNKFRRGL